MCSRDIVQSSRTKQPIAIGSVAMAHQRLVTTMVSTPIVMDTMRLPLRCCSTCFFLSHVNEDLATTGMRQLVCCDCGSSYFASHLSVSLRLHMQGLHEHVQGWSLCSCTPIEFDQSFCYNACGHGSTASCCQPGSFCKGGTLARLPSVQSL